jgi:hypothetical protein
MTEEATIETPSIELIMKIVGVTNEADAVQAVWNLKENVTQLEAMLNSLTVVPVVMSQGQPLFVQLPPNVPQEQFAPELLESIRDALVGASVYLRLPLLRSRARVEEKVANKG